MSFERPGERGGRVSESLDDQRPVLRVLRLTEESAHADRSERQGRRRGRRKSLLCLGAETPD